MPTTNSLTAAVITAFKDISNAHVPESITAQDAVRYVSKKILIFHRDEINEKFEYHWKNKLLKFEKKRKSQSHTHTITSHFCEGDCPARTCRIRTMPNPVLVKQRYPKMSECIVRNAFVEKYLAVNKCRIFKKISDQNFNAVIKNHFHIIGSKL